MFRLPSGTRTPQGTLFADGATWSRVHPIHRGSEPPSPPGVRMRAEPAREAIPEPLDWWCEVVLNHRPADYESAALPLSYHTARSGASAPSQSHLSPHEDRYSRTCPSDQYVEILILSDSSVSLFRRGNSSAPKSRIPSIVSFIFRIRSRSVSDIMKMLFSPSW